MRAGKFLLFFTILFSLLLCALSADVRAAKDEQELLLGLIPEENIFNQMKRHRPLAQYMTKKLGIKVRFTVLSRYPHIITRFTRRELDGAFFGIFTSVLAEESLNIEPIARAVNSDGKSTARGYLFVRKDSGIKSIAQLRGKRAVFVDQVTATGYLFAIATLKQHGVRNLAHFFSEQTLTGSHDSTVYSVVSGQADIGAAKGRIVDRMIKEDSFVKENIHILAISEELPDNTLFLRKDLPINLKLKIQQTLLDMHDDPEGASVLANFKAKRFIESTSGDFKPVRDMARKAGVNIKHFKYDY